MNDHGDTVAVWLSFEHSRASGMGLVQHHIAAALERNPGLDVHRGSQAEFVGHGLPARVRGVGREWLSAARQRSAIGVISSSPAPIIWPKHSLYIAHDLRWRDTRSATARAYRNLDLRVAARRASIVCASAPGIADEIAHHTGVSPRLLPFGPGRAVDWNSSAGNGDVVLLGSAPHKRNERAAQLLVAHDGWYERVMAVNVSADTQSILGELPASRVDVHERPSDDALRGVFERSSWFVHLGCHEGFGFPYLEALAAGCTVIAMRYPTTEFVLGDAGVLLDEHELDAAFESLEQGGLRLPDQLSIDQQVSRFSWQRFDETLASLVDELRTEML